MRKISVIIGWYDEQDPEERPFYCDPGEVVIEKVLDRAASDADPDLNRRKGESIYQVLLGSEAERDQWEHDKANKGFSSPTLGDVFRNAKKL